MLYIIAVFLGIIMGILIGGRISNILNLKFKKAWIVIGVFTVQAVAQIMISKGSGFVKANILIIQGAVYCLLLVVFWVNRRYLGVVISGVGCLSNALVMMANGGKMPVSYAALQAAGVMDAARILESGLDSKHVVIGENTRLVFLADVIHPPGLLGVMMKVVSAGDLIIAVGLFILFFEVVSDRQFLDGGNKDVKDN